MDHSQPPFIDAFCFSTDSASDARRRVINVMPSAFAFSFTSAAHTGPAAKAACNHAVAYASADKFCGTISDCRTSSALMETGWDSHTTRDVDSCPAELCIVAVSI